MSTVKNVTAAKKPAVSAKAASIEKTVEKKEEAVKKEGKKEVEAVKPAVKKAVKKTTEKAATAKKTVAKAATKKSFKISIQYAEKDYSIADLEKIATDVWVYDCGKKAADLKDIELYVKPEENKVYYVFNGTVAGNFDI